MATRLPATLREVPDSWWDLIMNTGPWYISSENFELPVDLAEFRNFFYRRAQTRRLNVATKIVKHKRRLYMQARTKHFYEESPVWDDARAAPPLHPAVKQRGLEDRYLALAEGMITLFRAHGFQVTLPEPDPESGLEPAPVKPFNIWDLPIPEGWTRSVYTNRLLPPGVPDIKGAIYEDDATREDMIASAVEFQEAAQRCTCGTEDLRKHPPSCPVWG